MSVHVDPAVLRADARIVAPPAVRACDDHGFELPTGIYAALGSLLAGFLAVLAVGLSTPGLILPMTINFAFLTAFFAVPAIFVRSAHDRTGALRWSQFMRKGIETATGHSSGKEAAVLVLTLPLFIFFWAIAIVAIVAWA